MACRKGNSSEEEKNRNAASTAASSSVVVSDALLFATMCIIGMPVDVHAKDGSVYSGIFYTASVDNEYAIVLKNARMIKKGNQEANVVSGSLIETLIVPSENFVQVVAKEIRLPANGVTVSEEGKGVEEAIVGYEEYPEREAKAIKLNESEGDIKCRNQTRFSANMENGFSDSSTAKTATILGCSLEEPNERLDRVQSAEMHEALTVSVDQRPVDGPQEIKSYSRDIAELQDGKINHENQSSRPSTAAVIISEKTDIKESPKKICAGYSTTIEDQRKKTPASDGTACIVGYPPKDSATSIPSSGINTESRLRASSASYVPLVLPKSSNLKKTVKESTLNPGAKIFSPSMLHHRSATPPAMPNGAGASSMPDACTSAPIATAQREVDVSSFAHPSVPVKFVPHNNVAIADAGLDMSYVQPITGQVLSRTQPVRYASQYPNLQTGHGYVHPNPQNITLGRVGPLVCVHPVANDAVQSAAGFSQPTSRSLLTPHLSKHQGNPPAQALQLCMASPIIANGPQQFVIPTSIPISQPLYPVLRPIAVPRSNGFFNTKFA